MRRASVADVQNSRARGATRAWRFQSISLMLARLVPWFVNDVHGILAGSHAGGYYRRRSPPAFESRPRSIARLAPSLNFTGLARPRVARRRALRAGADAIRAKYQAEWPRTRRRHQPHAGTRVDTPRSCLRQRCARTEEENRPLCRPPSGSRAAAWGTDAGRAAEPRLRSPSVVSLRRRLILSGDLDPTAWRLRYPNETASIERPSPLPDPARLTPHRRAQHRHRGLAEVPGQVRSSARAQRVCACAPTRCDPRRAPRHREHPSATVEAVQDGGRASRHAAVSAGSIGPRRSFFANHRDHFKPDLNGARPIIRRDLIPLDARRIRPTSPTTASASSPTTRGQERSRQRERPIGFSRTEGRRANVFRQDHRAASSTRSASVRKSTTCPTRTAVYMHDTPARGMLPATTSASSPRAACRIQSVRAAGRVAPRRAGGLGTAPRSTATFP